MTEARRWLMLGVLSAMLGAGCAEKLPPHVYLPIHNLEGVDLFWWTDTEQCTMRVLVWRRGGRAVSGEPNELAQFTVPVDKSLCYAYLRGVGYAVPKEKP